MSSRAFPRRVQATGGAFYLHGDDQFRKEEALRELIDAHVDPATRDFNLDPLRGTEVDPETLASVLATPPMMAEWRVVVLREVEGLASTKRARDELLRVVADPPPGLALLMSGTVPKGSKAKFYSDLAEARALGRVQGDHGRGRSRLAHGAGRGGARGRHRRRRREGAGRGDRSGPRRAGPRAREAVGVRGGPGSGSTSRTSTPRAPRCRPRTVGRGSTSWVSRRFEEARLALGTLIGQGESGVGLVIGLTTHLLRLGVAVDQGVAGAGGGVARSSEVAGQAHEGASEEVDDAGDRSRR